jgi:arabinofuranosyltransferase
LSSPRNLSPPLVVATAVALVVMVLHACRYYFLCDDAYIAFRYAHNLAVGRGLVFNMNERVEGYTSLLWTLQMALGEALAVSSEGLAPLLEVAYTIGSLAICWKLVRSHQAPGREFAPPLLAGLLAVNRTWAVWTTSGLETRSFSFFVLAAIYCVWRGTRESGELRRGRWLLVTSATLTCAALSRPDAQLFVPLFAAYAFWNDVRTVRQFGRLLGPFTIFLSLHYLWRKCYYGDWLPNTFYAKVHTNAHWSDLGWRLLGAFVLEHAYYLMIPVGALAYVLASRELRRLYVLALACMTIHAVAYCHLIGGDVFEFRIFDFFVPLLAWIAAEGIATFTAQRPVAGVAACLVLFSYSSAIPLSAWVTTKEFTANDAFVPEGQFKVTPSNTPLATVLPGLSASIRAEAALLALLYPHYIGVRQEVHRTFWESRVEAFRRARYSRDLENLQDIVTANGSIGVLGYYVDLPLVDILGLTDAEISHRGMRRSGRLMAHDLRPPPGYLERRGVRAVLISATDEPYSEADPSRLLFLLMPFVDVPDGTAKTYSRKLDTGAWLNFLAWDPFWAEQRSTYR